ncbi:MAG: hypothetical protein HUK24_02195 [Sphaerochaetaceae bacterium]|nr:hypothetical protein [Sphaerochaetaceae bacterium]
MKDFNEEYQKAISIVKETRNSSPSFLQRKLYISYNMASAIVEKMTEEGLLGPYNGSKPREVLF